MGLRHSGEHATAVICLVLMCSACLTPAMPDPITEPVVDRPGETLVRYRDRFVEVVVEFGFADNNIADEWLILNAAFSGMTGGATTIDRRLISVRTPDGRTIPLPSYKEFNAAYGDLASAARRAKLASQPLDFTRGGRRPCSIGFMPLPGSGEVANTAINVTKNELCVGLLFFPVRGGVQPGRWKLVIELEEAKATVPFALGYDVS